jgi:4-carboxymuconolactone decarboxylase
MEIARTILGNDMALSVRTRELVILQVGQLSGAAYERSQHEPLALRAGIERRQIEALRRGDEEDGFDEADRLVLRFVREALIAADVSDEAWAAAAALYEPRALTELIVIVGFYRMMCTLMRAARLPVEAPIDRPWPSPEGSSLQPPVAQS